MNYLAFNLNVSMVCCFVRILTGPNRTLDTYIMIEGK